MCSLWSFCNSVLFVTCVLPSDIHTGGSELVLSSPWFDVKRMHFDRMCVSLGMDILCRWWHMSFGLCVYEAFIMFPVF